MKREIEIPEGYEARIEDNKVIIEQKASDDEKIRQFLVDEVLVHIGMLYIEGDKVVNNTKNELWKKALSYLERQKEQNQAKWSKEDDAAHTRILGAVAKAFMGELPTKPSEEDVQWLKTLPERFKLQPKQEWSEKDENMLDSIIATCKLAVQDNDSGQARHLFEMQERFLKSLRPQSKQEWSDEDKDYYDAIITKLEVTQDDALLTPNQMNFLKSLCPLPHWKPSEEQMAILRAVLNDNNNITSESANITLESLYNDLKKLIQK